MGRSAETKETHTLYWRKLTTLHRETIALLDSIGSEETQPDSADRAAFETILQHLIHFHLESAINHARFYSNYSGESTPLFQRILEILENLKETLPETEAQISAIAYNVCSDAQLVKIRDNEIPDEVTKGIIFLTGRRKGFIVERIELLLVTIALAMEKENGNG